MRSKRNPLPFDMSQQQFDDFTLRWNILDSKGDKKRLAEIKAETSRTSDEEAHKRRSIEQIQQRIKENLLLQQQLGSSPSDRSRPLALHESAGLSLRDSSTDQEHFYVSAIFTGRPANTPCWLDSDQRSLVVGDQVLFKFDVPANGGTALVSSSFVPLSDTTFRQVQSSFYVNLADGKLLAPIDGVGHSKSFVKFDISPESYGLINKSWPQIKRSTRKSEVNFDVKYPSQEDVEAYWENAAPMGLIRLSQTGVPFEGILDLNKRDADDELVRDLLAQGITGERSTPVLVVPSAYGTKQFYELYHISSQPYKDTKTGTVEHFSVPQRNVVKSDQYPLESVLSVIWRRPSSGRQVSSASPALPTAVPPPQLPSAPVATSRVAPLPTTTTPTSVTSPPGQNLIFAKTLPADPSYSVVYSPSGDFYVLDSAGNEVYGPVLFFKANKFVPSRSNPSEQPSTYTVEHDGRRYVILRDGEDTGKYAFSEEKANTLVERMKGTRRPRRPRRGES